jgi:TetR/AcrR family transcriptional regulator, transcriptional repressor for nem operon
MRYTKHHKAATRKRVLDTSGALAKKNGFAATGVDALMEAAGLTVGAFYVHFGSKSEMLQSLIEHELQRSLQRFGLETKEAVAAALDSYLSLAHVEHPGGGCVLSTLTPEVGRAGASVRKAFEHQLLEIQGRIAAQTRDQASAWSILSQLVGAVMLARAMHSRTSREALLKGVHSATSAALLGENG